MYINNEMVFLLIYMGYDVVSIFWSEDKENVIYYVLYIYCVKRFGISEIFVLNSKKKEFFYF